MAVEEHEALFQLQRLIEGSLDGAHVLLFDEFFLKMVNHRGEGTYLAHDQVAEEKNVHRMTRRQVRFDVVQEEIDDLLLT